jgi:hypothetical protein
VRLAAPAFNHQTKLLERDDDSALLPLAAWQLADQERAVEGERTQFNYSSPETDARLRSESLGRVFCRLQETSRSLAVESFDVDDSAVDHEKSSVVESN